MLKKIKLQKHIEDQKDQENSISFLTPEDYGSDPLLVVPIFAMTTAKMPALSSLEEKKSPDLENIQTIGNDTRTAKRSRFIIHRIGNQFTELGGLIKNSGVYALSSIVTPLLSLALAPFLTHNLSASDYGILALLNTAISLVTGITQLGLGSAFFRAYSYDYTEARDKLDVVAATTSLLLIISTLTIIAISFTASFIADILLGQQSLGMLIIIASGVVLVQNLTVPSFSWLRAENRALFYSLLSIGNMVITLLANIFLVGVLHQGLTGALISIGVGQISGVIFTIPFIISRAGIRIRKDIARNLLGFGLPLTFSFMSSWILQLSDRYLLSHFSSTAETAKYTIAYTLGSALSVVIIGPFSLAWPSTMFAFAKSKEPERAFQLMFRWFSLLLLLAAFGLSFINVFLLNWLFPVSYHSKGFVIPIVSTSLVFNGIYFILTTGISLTRKTWVHTASTTLSAVINLLLNLFLIPQYGAMGAALSTLAAYIAMALAAYLVNQKIYPIPFEIGRFISALLLGTAIYLECSSITRTQSLYASIITDICAFALYTCCLVIIGILPTRKNSHNTHTDISPGDAYATPVSSDL